MSFRIDSTTPITAEPARGGVTKTEKGADFAGVLTDALSEAHSAEKSAGEAMNAFVEGKGGIHEAIIAQEKASIAVRYAVTLKNRALEAYRDLMNTPI